MIKIEVPKIPALYTGSGDLFAALFLAHCYLTDDIKTSLENTINSLHDVLLKTYEYSQGKFITFPKIDSNLAVYYLNLECNELLLFQHSKTRKFREQEKLSCD